MSYGSVIEESGSAGSDYLYFRDGYYGSECVSPRRPQAIPPTAATTVPVRPRAVAA